MRAKRPERSLTGLPVPALSQRLALRPNSSTPPRNVSTVRCGRTGLDPRGPRVEHVPRSFAVVDLRGHGSNAHPSPTFRSASMNERNEAPLARALIANAIFSGLWALWLLVFPDSLSGLLGTVSGTWLRWVGVALAAFVPLLLAARNQVRLEEPRTELALAAVCLDMLWLLATLGLTPFAWTHFTSAGSALFFGVAFAVLALALLQWKGIDTLLREPDETMKTTHRVQFSAVVDVEPAAFWRTAADLGSIRDHLASLAESRLQGEPGVGAVRTCLNRRGQSWSEEVTQWIPGQQFSLRFLSDRPGFPFPMHPMLGGWKVAPCGSATRVTLWWSFTPRPRWLAPVIVTLLTSKVRPDMMATMKSMARSARLEAPKTTEPA